MHGDGVEPSNPKERIYSPLRLATSLPVQCDDAQFASPGATDSNEQEHLASVHAQPCYAVAQGLRIDRDSNPGTTFAASGFQDQCFRPLSHLSIPDGCYAYTAPILNLLFLPTQRATSMVYAYCESGTRTRNLRLMRPTS